MATSRERPRTPKRAEKRLTTRGPALLLHYLPRGNLLEQDAWRRRHTLLRWLLFLHAPALLAFGLARGYGLLTVTEVIAPIFACLGLAIMTTRRRLSSFFVTAGLVYCSSALVGLSSGAIEAHFHFFIIIGFIALYQDWVPFLWNIVFTVISHGLGSAWSSTLIFNHVDAQRNPWLWSLIHGVSVLAACVGMVIFWRYSEDEQERSIELRTRIAQAEIDRRRFTSDLLVNLARRNQAMLHRQLSILNRLEEKEPDPDALAELFQLDHLATRIRRNAESLLVLSGEDPPRMWAQPVRLLDVVRAAVAETEHLDRVIFEVDENLAVLGQIVTGVTHLLAELLENAVRFSDPTTNVTVRVRADPRTAGIQVLTVEDWGVGMPQDRLAAANELLADPPDVDLSTSGRFGLHVVSRLAQRHGIQVRLSTTGFAGVTAAVVLPAALFVSGRPTVTAESWPQHQLPDRRPEGITLDVRPERLRTDRRPEHQPTDLRPEHLPIDARSERLSIDRRPGRSIPHRREPSGHSPGVDPDTTPAFGFGAPAPGPAVSPETRRQWQGWWDRRPDGTDEPFPSAPPPAPAPGGIVATSGMIGLPGPDQPNEPQLAQRIPQRNLSPHLRRTAGAEGAPDGAADRTSAPAAGPAVRRPHDARQVADALSRYQANRRAALRTPGAARPGQDTVTEKGPEW